MLIPARWLDAGLPETITERVGEQTGRQRAMFAEGHLLLLLHEVPGPDDSEREGALFWRQPEGRWEFQDRGRGLPALEAHVGAYEQAVDRLEDEHQRAHTASEFFGVLEQVVPIHRAAKNLFGALQGARELVREARELIVLRDRAQEIARTAEILHADLKNAIDYRIAKRTEEQAESAHAMTVAGHRLNTLMAIFLPLTALGSLLGMNLPHGFERSEVWVFWVVFSAGLLLGLAVKAWVDSRPPSR